MELLNSKNTISNRLKFLIIALVLMLPGIALGAKYFDDIFATTFRSASQNPSTAGVLRLANSDSFGWRNNANTDNLLLSVDSSDRLLYNGVLLPTLASSDFTDSGFRIVDNGDSSKKIGFESSGITTGTTRTITMPDANVNLGALTNSNIDASAAIARTKLASGTASHVLINDGSGVMSSEAQLAGTRGGTGASNAGILSYGANNLTFTTSGATGVTLPTSGTLATLAGTETFTNKTLTSPTLTTPTVDILTIDGQASTPANPGAGFYKIYVKDDGKAYKLDSAGAETELGSGGGSGGINHITNPDAETNANDWAAYADAAGTEPVDGTGGAANVTLTRTTTSGEVLRGDASFKLAKDASDRQGEGVSTDFTVDAQDSEASKRLWVTFDYKTSADYVSGDIRVFALDVTNGTLLNVSNDDSGELQASTSPTTFTGAFYTVEGETSYRLILHVASTNASAYDVFLDNVKVSPDAVVPSPIVGEWKDAGAITFTGATSNPSKGTTTIDRVLYRRIGDSAEIRYEYRQTSAGTAGSGIYFVAMPDGLTIDTAKINSAAETTDPTTAYSSSVGNSTGHISAVTSVGPAFLQIYDSTKFGVHGAGAFSTYDPMSSAYYSLSNASLGFTLTITVPISEWSAGASISSTEMMMQTPRVVAYKNGGAVTADTTIASWSAKPKDNLGAFNLTSGEFTVPSDGDYQVSFHARTTTGISATAKVRVNGTDVLEGESTTADAARVVTGIIPNCKEGDVITVVLSVGGTLVSNDVSNYLSIHKIPDFSTFSVWPNTGTCYVKDVQAAGTEGGTPVGTTWTARALNTLEGDTSFCSLASNQVTLQPGKYEIEASAPFTQTDGVALRLRNITDGTTAIVGQKTSLATAGATSDNAHLMGVLTLTSAKTFELQYYVATVQATYGLGDGINTGESNVFAQMRIKKVQ